MKNFIQKFGTVMAVWCFTLTAIFAGVAVTFGTIKTNATTANDTTSYVSVGEIYNNPENVQKLYNLIAGHDNATLAELTTLATETEHTFHSSNYFSAVTFNGYNAADMRAGTFGKTDDQDIQVTFGGFRWQVVYLSMSESNDPIITLWGEFSGRNKWNDWYDNKNDCPYPANLYSTSYIRSLLNNGSAYSISGTELETDETKYAKNIYSSYAKLTVDKNIKENAVTDAIVCPADVSWQEAGQNVMNILGMRDTARNENWGDSAKTTNWGDNQIKENQREHYGAWKNDTLWLPSLSEIGYNDTYTGIWGLRNSQRVYSDNYWLRSAHTTDYYRPYMILEQGNMYYDIQVNYLYSFRPALHINLNAAPLCAHVHDVAEWNTTAATCGVAGSKTGVCSKCGETVTEIIPATGEHTWNGGEITKPNTCTENGVKTFTCTKCGTMRTEAIDAGHEFGDWEVIKAATCVEPGHKIRHCVNKLSDGTTPCDIFEEEEIPATGVHVYGGWITTKEPTTKETGEQEHKCTICGHTETNEIAKLTLKNKFKVVPVAAGTGAAVACLIGIVFVWATIAKKRHFRMAK